MRELLLLRHGRTEANERRVFGGSQDIPVSEGGIAELMAMREKYPPATTFFTSGMLRALQTLRVLYGDVPYTPIPALSEYDSGCYQGRTHEELLENEPSYALWLEPEGKNIVCPGGESRAQFEVRVRGGWQQFLDNQWEGLTVMISHGGVMNTIGRCFVPGYDITHRFGNGEGLRISLDDAGNITQWEHFA